MGGQDALAAIVLRERRERGWSQERLADAAGLNLRTIQRVECGSPCSGETILALAAALNVDASRLRAAAPHRRAQPLVPGRGGAQVKWVGALLCLPAVVFVGINVAYYELGMQVFEAVMSSEAWNSFADHSLAVPVVVGGPLAALLANLAFVVRLQLSVEPAATTLNGLILRRNPGQWLVAGLAFALLAAILAYGVVENLLPALHGNYG